jgi:predicted NACHT family NTPase
MSLLDYFEEWARTSYVLVVPSGAFEALLDEGRLLVIFDGLDELLDTSKRLEIRDEIESFCLRFPFTPVLVTSRKVGYDQAPLDRDIFDVVNLLDFDGPRVEAYADRWFEFQLASEPALDRAERRLHFLRESAVASDLRRSPLLLALLCSSYRGAGFIPKNLPDVYDSCATLLFSTWDKQRQIDVLLPFAEHVRPALRDLAWWLFTTGGVESAVTKRQAIERTTQYLHRRRFGDVDEARAAAEEFIEFCRGRAWVFSDQGTTAAGEPLFGFTHRTFLEFFAAEHLAYRKDTAAELVEQLTPRIVAQEWDVVAQIALQIKPEVTDSPRG